MRLLPCILFLVVSFASAQSGYKIELSIKGLRDTTAMLGYYYGETTRVTDTAHVNAQGDVVFEGNKRLPQGVFFFVLSKSLMFNILISGQQHFSMETSTEDYVRFMKVKGDEDNKLFYENMVYNGEMHKEADPYLKVIQDSTLKEDQKTAAREAFNKINDKVMAHQDEVIAAHPSTLTARMLRVTRDIVVPDPPKKADGSIDSTFQLRYYRQHYFDNLDLADDAMIRLPRPYYSDKLNEYLDKLFLQTPDSLMAAINQLALKARKNQETYKYLVWSCIYKYQRPTIMGLDEVYVRLYDKYFASGEMDYWINDALKKSVQEYANKLRPSLIGKTGANLTMQDASFQPKSLYDIKKKYTILYIFDPDCGHCREETPKLVSFYEKDKAKFGIEVFAVSADTSMQKMRNYIKEMKMTWITVNGPRTYVGAYSKLYYAETTPSLYVLDDKKKIIAKGIPAEKLEEFFVNYE
ncbi:MAG TPA: thioredoxin-like domain-containing protein, partial [Cyclobacteriaceae bacterium]|nr:thioredoxin-like domain-containing protein [Cyclobacteriaceae bacterium]